jgi:hypothetical protein
MAIKTLFISNKNHKWPLDVIRLSNSNFNKVIDSNLPNDYVTSVADLHINDLKIAIDSAGKIELVGDICNLSDYKNLGEFQWPTGHLYYTLYKVKYKVSNFNFLTKLSYKFLIKDRPTANPILWISGCSITYGVGVKPEETYGSNLAKKLNIPMINHAYGGQSIFWAVDKLLRSDIKKGDTVILGVTDLIRYEYCTDDWELYSRPITSPDYLEFIDLDYFDSPTHILKISRYILHLINFCDKIGANCIIANLLDTTWNTIIFNGCKNYIDLIDNISDGVAVFKDLGSDNQHPGILQHQEYADKIFDFIQKSKYNIV